MLVSREVGFRAYHSHHGMLVEPRHGHEYVVRITMAGEPNEEGFVCDFRAVKRLFKRLVVRDLEEKNLDELFEFPTAENLVHWIWVRLAPFFPLHSLELREKAHSSVLYLGPGEKQ
jgi:6-pyruvoyltetrahydropterin/6-carboxytetrahydropterin synthase